MATNQETTPDTQIVGDSLPSPSLDQRIELVDQHQAAIIGLMAAAVDDNLESGQTEDLLWKVEDLRGKHQKVYGVELTFSGDVNFSIVIRPSFKSDFKTLYSGSPALQKYFPHLYLSQPFTVEDPGQGTFAGDMLAIDKVRGYEMGSEFEQHIASPDNFNQLCVEFFQMMDEILQEPLSIGDTMPVDGHNVFYNTDTGHFQLFDVDTVRASDLPHHEKFRRLIDTWPRPVDDTRVGFIMRTIQMYRAKYPETKFSWATDETAQIEYHPVEDPTSDDKDLIRPDGPDDEDYREAYVSAIIAGRMTGYTDDDITDKPPLKRIEIPGRYVYSIPPDLLDAVDRDDLEAAKAIIKRLWGITQTEFVETESSLGSNENTR